MLSRVALGSLLLAGLVETTAHADPTDVGVATTATPASDDVTGDDLTADGATANRLEAVAGVTGAGARYLRVDERMFLDMQASIDGQRSAASARAGLARFTALGMEHELVAGLGYVHANGTDPAATDASTLPTPDATTTATEPQFPQTMPTQTPLTNKLRREHRFLSAYINDTVRFIRGLDVTGGLVVEQWKNLGGDSTITYGSGPPMDADTPDVEYLFGPTLSVTGHIGDHVDVVAQTYRGVREIGPDLHAGRFASRLRAFDSPELGTGLAGEASVQPLAPLVATVAYTRTEQRSLAAALVTYSDPRIATLSARIDTGSRFDALAVRSLRGGLSGYLGADNLLGAASEARRFHVGVRGAFGK